jgi:hypothetical protein
MIRLFQLFRSVSKRGETDKPLILKGKSPAASLFHCFREVVPAILIRARQSN